MSMKTPFLTLAFFSLIPSAYSVATSGCGGRGGGDALECTPIDPSLAADGFTELADLEDASAPYSTAMFDGLPPSEMEDRFLFHLDQTEPQASTALRAALAKLSFQFTSDPLPLLWTGVKDLGYLPDDVFYGDINNYSSLLAVSSLSCVKVQIAVQDFSTGIVTINQPTYNLLPSTQQGLLAIHEGYLKIAYDQSGDEVQAEQSARTQSLALWMEMFGVLNPTQL